MERINSFFVKKLLCTKGHIMSFKKIDSYETIFYNCKLCLHTITQEIGFYCSCSDADCKDDNANYHPYCSMKLKEVEIKYSIKYFESE